MTRMHNPPHPGKIIHEECLAPLGLTETRAAQGLGVTTEALSELLNGHSGVSPEMAVRLAKAFGSSPETWLRLQLQYDLATVEKLAGGIQVESFSKLLETVKEPLALSIADVEKELNLPKNILQEVEGLSRDWHFVACMASFFETIMMSIVSEYDCNRHDLCIICRTKGCNPRIKTEELIEFVCNRAFKCSVVQEQGTEYWKGMLEGIFDLRNEYVHDIQNYQLGIDSVRKKKKCPFCKIKSNFNNIENHQCWKEQMSHYSKVVQNVKPERHVILVALIALCAWWKQHAVGKGNAPGFTGQAGATIQG
jgi:antitoxin HigA-1